MLYTTGTFAYFDLITVAKYYSGCFLGKTFPTNFDSLIKKISRLLYHVLIHIYLSHWSQLTLLGIASHASAVGAHFVAFVGQFQLLDVKDFSAMSEMCQKLRRHVISSQRANCSQQTQTVVEKPSDSVKTGEMVTVTEKTINTNPFLCNNEQQSAPTTGLPVLDFGLPSLHTQFDVLQTNPFLANDVNQNRCQVLDDVVMRPVSGEGFAAVSATDNISEPLSLRAPMPNVVMHQPQSAVAVMMPLVGSTLENRHSDTMEYMSSNVAFDSLISGDKD